MFHATERLPHLLPPAAYWTAAQFQWEMSNVFSRSWHFVGLQSQLTRPGDFLTTEICGMPIQVRNISGVLHCVSNVCAHRHCLLTSLKSGNSPTLRCQYHGWEYAATGGSQRIPAAQNFAPLDRSSIRIPVYRVESVGPLIFVNLDAAAPDLKTVCGDTYQVMDRSFGEGWQLTLSREISQPVNWKIPIENSLEAYHVPAVHPDTFRSDPGEERSEHFLGEYSSWFKTTLPFAPQSAMDARFQQIEGHLFKFVTGQAPTTVYQQHHLFPNILCSFTDMISLLHCVRPTGPESCTSIVLQFGRVGEKFPRRQIGKIWGRLAAGITSKILKEDFGLYPDIQRGMKASQNPGMLGRCEERIHQFQKWLQSQPGSAISKPVLYPENGDERMPLCDCSAPGHSREPANQTT